MYVSQIWDGTSSTATSRTSKRCAAASTAGSFVPDTPSVNSSSGGVGSTLATPRGASSSATGAPGSSSGLSPPRKISTTSSALSESELRLFTHSGAPGMWRRKSCVAGWKTHTLTTSNVCAATSASRSDVPAMPWVNPPGGGTGRTRG